MAHMNSDHSDACLLIVQTLGGMPAAVRSTMQSMDSTHVEFLIETDDGITGQVSVEFSKPIARDSQIRGHLVAMTKQARALSQR